MVFLKQKTKKTAKLNVDIATAISDFQEIMKEFRLKRDIYKLLFRGKGLEFEAFRDYTPDDDASDIDWRASNRSMKLLVKQYKEERDLKIIFMIDVGSNMVFGSGDKLKCEFNTELVAAFAKVIMDINDRVGFILFSDKVHHFIAPKNGEKHFRFFIDMLSDISQYGGNTNLDAALDFAMEYLDNSIHSVIVVSDFLKVTNQTEKKLSLISHRYETILIRVRDLLDMTLPSVQGELILENPVTGEQVVVSPKFAKATYEKYAYEQAKAVEEIIKRTEADSLDLVTNKSFAVPLALFLKRRVEGGL
ncbi:MAG: DUF58 domain-containing protein [Nanoarchaeota archaeon]|nr:DUF58 domain-containing protein [Nanoarchaeota archaeon]